MLWLCPPGRRAHGPQPGLRLVATVYMLNFEESPHLRPGFEFLQVGWEGKLGERARTVCLLLSKMEMEGALLKKEKNPLCILSLELVLKAKGPRKPVLMQTKGNEIKDGPGADSTNGFEHDFEST